jgi:diaminohydroxyphosphoribosylaminopyrimidine deaminase/5-amino-6-(5-phosphoribosylamino)uracil reductase
MSADGKLASRQHDSRWISGELARGWAQRLRREAEAVIVGVNTVLADDPLLTVRHPEALKNAPASVNPLRIILDSQARTPLTAKVIQNSDASTWVAVTAKADSARLKALSEKVKVITVQADIRGQIDWHDLLRMLGQEGINSVLVEGGSAVLGSAIDAGIADKVYIFVAPKIIGGREALTPVAGQGVERMVSALTLSEYSWQPVGEDLLLTGYLTGKKE